MLFWPFTNYRPIISKSKQRLMLTCYFHEIIEKPPPVACSRHWKHNNDDTVTLFSVNRAFIFYFIYLFIFFTVAVNEPISQFSFCQEHTWITNLVTRQSWVSLNTDPVTENRSKWKTWHKVIQTWSCTNWMFPSCTKLEISSNKLHV